MKSTRTFAVPFPKNTFPRYQHGSAYLLRIAPLPFLRQISSSANGKQYISYHFIFLHNVSLFLKYLIFFLSHCQFCLLLHSSHLEQLQYILNKSSLNFIFLCRLSLIFFFLFTCATPITVLCRAHLVSPFLVNIAIFSLGLMSRKVKYFFPSTVLSKFLNCK